VRHLLLLTLLLPACTPADAPPADDDDDTPFVQGPWLREQPPLDVEVRGRRELRTITHLHSHWSHDACDGNPQPGGIPDEDCLQHLRDAMCSNRIDVAFLSDHPGHADETDLETMALIRGDDEALPFGEGWANRMTCPSGHQTLFLPGIESSSMMPFGIQAHTPESWGTWGPEAFEDVRTRTQAAMWINHTEGREVKELATLRPDGIELYQLHANLAPNIRRDDLGLDPYSVLAEIGPFFFPESNGILDPPQPDLGVLAFVEPNEPSIVALEVLGQDQRLGVSGGTDAHENTFPVDAGDGERIDSYRRMTRWFHTRIRADGSEPGDAVDALKQARSWVVFEAMGTPRGFDLYAEGDELTELGEEVAFAEGMTLHVSPPTLDPVSPRGPDAPGVRTTVFRATPERSVIDEWEGAEARDVALPGPGVYRVEVHITPRHLRPFLGEVAEEFANKEVPWILSGAVFVR
jgi:hypothetical protein